MSDSLKCSYCKDKNGKFLIFSTVQNKKRHLQSKKHKNNVDKINCEFSDIGNIVSMKNKILILEEENIILKNEIKELKNTINNIQKIKKGNNIAFDMDINNTDFNKKNQSTQKNIIKKEIPVEKEPETIKVNEPTKEMDIILDCGVTYQYNVETNFIQEKLHW